MFYLGIDPGKDGGFCLLNSEGHIIETMATPPHKDKRICHEGVERFMAKVIRHAGDRDNVTVYTERVHAVFGNSATSMFTFGFHTGYLFALTHSFLGRDVVEIAPIKWQKFLTGYADINEVYKNELTAKGNKKRDTKATAAKAVSKLYKGFDFRKNKACRIPHDGIVDATGIALYALHQHN